MCIKLVLEKRLTMMHGQKKHKIVSSVFISITCWGRQCLRKVWPTQLAFHLFIVYWLFHSSLTLCNIFSFFTRSVQLISILLHHNISVLTRYLWFTYRSVQFSHSPKCVALPTVFWICLLKVWVHVMFGDVYLGILLEAARRLWNH